MMDIDEPGEKDHLSSNSNIIPLSPHMALSEQPNLCLSEELNASSCSFGSGSGPNSASSINQPSRNKSPSYSGSNCKSEVEMLKNMVIDSSSEEISAIQMWKQTQQEKIASREAASAQSHKEILEQAIKDIETFYQEYNQNKASTIAANRQRFVKHSQSQENQMASPVPSTDNGNKEEFWIATRKIVEKIKRLKNSKDITRMKEVISFSPVVD